MSSTARAFTDLVSWFQSHKRSFPWRVSPTPYSVWISEVMLQQTQASRVVSFFLRWMEQFPSLYDLSQATEHEVIKLWEGLGYYSRVRSLRKGSIVITEQHKGIFPQDRSTLLLIPGIGPYTQGAIRSFAFHQRAPAVDANVERVLSRWMDLAIVKGSSSARREVETLLERILPIREPHVAMESLIELGALVCQKKPLCRRCPFCASCLSLKRGSLCERPLVKASVTRIKEKRVVFLFQKQNEFCVVHRKGTRAMSGLFEFPYSIFSDSPFSLLERFDSTTMVPLDVVTHSYTKYTVTLYPFLIPVLSDFSWQEGEWVAVETLDSLPFSSGHKRILHQIQAMTG